MPAGGGRAERKFIPNDLYVETEGPSLLLITGPNMGGKSTYLRQAALLVIMAQMGCFVPAKSMRLGIVDRIYTRIGASDNVARGRSTFMVEMTETATILNTATPQSLILLDEMGRGTATFDGLSLAWATLEYLHAQVGARTLFATHYHELTLLAEQLPRTEEPARRGQGNPQGHRLSARHRARRGQQELRHRGGAAGRAARSRSSNARARCCCSTSSPRSGTSPVETEAPLQLTMFTPALAAHRRSSRADRHQQPDSAAGPESSRRA